MTALTAYADWDFQRVPCMQECRPQEPDTGPASGSRPIQNTHILPKKRQRRTAQKFMTLKTQGISSILGLRRKTRRMIRFYTARQATFSGTERKAWRQEVSFLRRRNSCQRRRRGSLFLRQVNWIRNIPCRGWMKMTSPMLFSYLNSERRTRKLRPDYLKSMKVR